LSLEEEKKNPANQTKYEPGYNESIELQIKLNICMVEDKKDTKTKPNISQAEEKKIL
jgi:hypothetical protein